MEENLLETKEELKMGLGFTSSSSRTKCLKMQQELQWNRLDQIIDTYQNGPVKVQT